MSSIRKQLKRTAGLSLLALLAMGGCQTVNPVPPPSPLNTTPLVVDEAMQNRDWEPTAAAYQNDVVTANPTDWTLHPDPAKQPGSGLVEPGTYLLNIGLLPYAIIKDPPWEPAQSKAMVMEPTYTGNEPLPGVAGASGEVARRVFSPSPGTPRRGSGEGDFEFAETLRFAPEAKPCELHEVSISRFRRGASVGFPSHRACGRYDRSVDQHRRVSA